MDNFRDNPIIKKRFEEKIKRWDKRDLGINFCWSVNCAIASLSEAQKEKKNWFKEIQKRYPKFIDEYRSFMIENMPVEPVKLTSTDFAQARTEAPAEQAKQEQANEIPPEEDKTTEEETTTVPLEEI